MSKHANKTFLSAAQIRSWMLAPVSAALMALAGCGGAGGGESTATAASTPVTQPQAEVTLSGGAIKGVIQNALVTARTIVDNGAGVYVEGASLATSVRTDNHGQFNLKIKNAKAELVMVELSADSQTRMICDVFEGCDSAQAASRVPFGQSFPLSSSFKLRAAVNLQTNKTVFLTPLSHLAVALAERGSNGLSQASINGAYSQVEQWFSLDAGALSLAPPDLTQLNGAQDVDAVQLAVVNAAFLSLVNKPEWTAIDEVLAAAVAKVSSQGGLDLVAATASDVSVSDLLLESTLLASDLQANVSNSLAQQALAVTQQRSQKAYADALFAAAEMPAAEPVVSAPVASEPVASEPVASEPVASEPVASEPVPVAANFAILEWTIPGTRVNGEGLTMGELDGYVIAYGQAADQLNLTLAIHDPSVVTTTLSDLPAGQWFFAIRVVDVDGNSSALSQVVSKTI